MKTPEPISTVNQLSSHPIKYSLALLRAVLGRVRAVEELPVEQLDADHGEDEQEEHVDDQDVEHILQRGDDAVEDGLQRGNAVHHLERAEHSQQLHGLEVLAGLCAPVELSNWVNRALNLGPSLIITHLKKIDVSAHDTTRMSMTFQKSRM